MKFAKDDPNDVNETSEWLKIETPDAAKLSQILSKLYPLHAVRSLTRPGASRIKDFLKGLTAVYLSVGLLASPAFASDFTLAPSPTVLTPTITSDQALTADTSTTPTTTTSTSSSLDSFATWEPLSAATSTSTTTKTTPTYYVSPTGSDTGDGSEANAWKSISYASSQLQAGDTLFIKEGNYRITAGTTFATSGTADAPITIQGLGNVILDGVDLYAYTPIFNTAGKSYLDFKNLTVKNSRAAVQVNSNSTHITVDGLRANNNHFAVDIEQGSYVTVSNVVAADNRNAFRSAGTSHHLSFNNIEAYGSQDIYGGYETKYRNGDGFIFELDVHDVVMKNIISHDNWDGGIDCKASNVLIDGVIVYSNKNNFKMWGNNIVIQNSLSYGARILTDDPVAGEGNGLNARTGSIKVLNSTFFDNAALDIQVDDQGGASNVTVENSIFYRNVANGSMFGMYGGNFSEKNNLFYWTGHTNPGFAINSSSKWADPQFVNSSAADLPLLYNTSPNTRSLELVKPKVDLKLKSTSPAINFGDSSLITASTDLGDNTRILGSSVDVGAYEYVAAPTADTTAPVLSAVTSSNLTSSGASINWTTNEASDSLVEYRKQGTTAWLATSLNTAMVLNHSAVLSGLTAGTLYEYRVKSKDAAGNLATQAAVMSFTTTASTPAACTTALCGVTAGQTVSGVVKIQPNLILNPDVRKVSYYLNGTSAGKEYAAPFTWGGVSGYDTTKMADGTYTLSGAYTTTTGDKSFSLTFAVKNTVVTPPADTTAPVMSAVAASGVSSSAANISWTTNEASYSQVEYRIQGTTAWLSTSINVSMVLNHSLALSGLTAGSQYEYRVKSKDAAGNLAIQSTVSSFTTSVPTTTCTTAMCGVTAGQTLSGVVKLQPNLTLNPNVRKVSYYVNGVLSGREYSTPFTWGGVNGFDTTQLTDGTYMLSGAYTTSTGDTNFSLSVTVKNAVVTLPPVTACTTAICGVTANQTVSGTIMVQPNLTLNPDVKKVAYYLNGTLSTKEYTSPFTWGGATGLDTTKMADGTYTLSGAYTTSTGDKTFSITFTVKNSVSVPAPVVCTTAMCGVSSGQVLSGTVEIKPNLTLNPDIRKVAYYVNGVLVTRVYTSPFTWQFDTKNMANGTYTIGGAYTTAAGDVSFSYVVTINN